MPVKISLVGAGSASFGLKSLYDIASSPELAGSEVFLADVDESKLEVMKSVAVSLNKNFNAHLKIGASSVLRDALNGSQFVLIAADIQYNKMWKINFEIPFRHGVKQVIGSCGGPGGLAHTLITVPLILDICKEIEDHCKDAVILNYTNPESRVVRAISKYTKLKAYGLCPGIYERLDAFADLFHVRSDDFIPFAAGLNHFTWLLDIRFKDGREVYPILDEMLRSLPNFEPLSRELYRIFGYYPSPGDTLTGEYIPYAWDIIPESGRGMNHIRMIEERGERVTKEALSVASGNAPSASMSKVMTGIGVRIIKAMLSNTTHYEYSINMPNGGSISNLPIETAVEIPASIDKTGIHGISVGGLPIGIAEMCNTQATIQELAVQAAFEGSYEKALQALVLDPVVSSPAQARETLDDLLKIHSALLPKFRK